VFASNGTMTARAIQSGKPVVVESSAGTPERPLVLGPTMVIPMITAGSPRGALIVSRGPGSRSFSHQEVELAADFAAQASVALELAAARVDQQRLLVLEDRSRIARDLHDHVIQRLFAAGLSLQAAAGQVSDTRIKTRIADQVQSLDEAIVAIRTAIFTLTAEPEERPPLRHRVIDLLSELGGLFDVSPRLAIAGPVELSVPDALAEDLLAPGRMTCPSRSPSITTTWRSRSLTTEWASATPGGAAASRTWNAERAGVAARRVWCGGPRAGHG
jgi:signal transduction histidine kinase